MTAPTTASDSGAAAVYALAAEFARAAQAATTRVNLGPGRTHEVLSTPGILSTACAAQLFVKAALLGLGTCSAEALENLDLEGLYNALPAVAQSALQMSMGVGPALLIERLRQIGGACELWRALGVVADGAVDAAFLSRFARAAQSVAAEALQ